MNYDVAVINPASLKIDTLPFWVCYQVIARLNKKNLNRE